MPDNLEPGVVTITSVGANDRPLGVDDIRPDSQPILVDGSTSSCSLKAAASPTTYHISIGGYPYTGIVDNIVDGSIQKEQDQVWRIEYQELQDAYTISAVNDYNQGWTVEGGSNVASGRHVKVAPIASTESIPPQFIPTQLFRFTPIQV